MTNQEALDLVRQLLKAPNDQELEKLVADNISRVDGTFMSVLSKSVEQLRLENKPEMADALESLGERMLRMKTLI